LILLPPLFFLRQLLLVLDRSFGGSSVRTFLEASFGFWKGGLPIEYRARALINLLLLLVAAAVGIAAAIGGVGRILAMLVAAAQALVCPVGIVWDHASLLSIPPRAIRRLPLPVPGGRATSAFYLLLAVAAFFFALADRKTKIPVSEQPGTPPPWSAPTGRGWSAPPPSAPPQSAPPQSAPPASGWEPPPPPP